VADAARPLPVVQLAISPLYPAVELATAGLVAVCFVAFGLSAEAFVASFFCVVLVVLSAIDLEHRIVPSRIVRPAAGVVLVAQTALHPSPEWVLAALGASGFLFVAFLVYPAGMGMGDVRLAFLMGAMLGRTVPAALMVGMVAALVPSVVLLARHGAAARKMGIPVRAVPRLRRAGRAVLRRRAAERVSGHVLTLT
jgi:leader peptidase (prepilin peptidase)/N-methyltransferase